MRARPDTSFAYAHARIQARHGSRLGNGDWQQLEVTRDLPALLQSARSTSLAPWIDRFNPHAPVHEYERVLRVNWSEYVDAIAEWLPEKWRAAVRWMRWLPYLPALQKLARGGRVTDWARRDPVLGPIVAEEPRDRVATLKQGELAPLASGFDASSSIGAAWMRHWRSLWPASAEVARAPVEAIARAVARYLQALEALPEAAGSADARDALAARLERVFRRNPLSPAAVIAHLALTALDVDRLRGALAARALVRTGEKAA